MEGTRLLHKRGFASAKDEEKLAQDAGGNPAPALRVLPLRLMAKMMQGSRDCGFVLQVAENVVFI